MNQWSSRRKVLIFFITLLFLSVIIGLPLFFLLYQAPTCSDGKQNGDESGIDCGGSCQLLCPAESLPLLSQGDPKVLEVVPGVYEVAALFKNPNVSAEVLRARYVVNVYGQEASPIKTIEAEAFIPRNSSFAVFEGPFELAEEPVRATVEWRASYLIWEKNDETSPKPSVRNILLSQEDSAPRVDAVLLNGSLDRINNVEATVLVYDTNGNVIASSKTFEDEILPGKSVPIVFSWPGPFKEESGKIEVIIRILPDTSFIR